MIVVLADWDCMCACMAFCIGVYIGLIAGDSLLLESCCWCERMRLASYTYYDYLILELIVMLLEGESEKDPYTIL